jgi:phosphatidylglycerophosphate synthase
VNLPNAITVGRIAMTPFIAWLPFTTSWSSRFAGFVLFLIAAISDYWDGHFARQRNLVTDLGRLLDPLADKMLLVATMVPMYFMQRSSSMVVDAATADAHATRYLFVTPFGLVAFPLFILVVILGRELVMTLFRQYAAKRGIVIAAIGPAKWKTGFQFTWIGAAYFWFFAQALAAGQGWTNEPMWHAFALFNGVVGVVTMIAATVLTVYSLWLYVERYGAQVARG